jgi:hypothetical protein
MADPAKQELDAAFEGLQREVPDPLCRAIRWLRDPKAKVVRIPLGLLFIAGSFLFFLPVLGLELLPIGLLLLAIDVPFLRKPVARATLWLEHQWMRLRARWHQRHRKRPAS